MVPKCRLARFGPVGPVIVPVVATGTGSTSVAGGGLAATLAVMTRNTISTDCVVKLEDTTTVAGLTPAAPAAPKCARARLHSALRRASVTLTQLFASAAVLIVA